MITQHSINRRVTGTSLWQEDLWQRFAGNLLVNSRQRYRVLINCQQFNHLLQLVRKQGQGQTYS